MSDPLLHRFRNNSLLIIGILATCLLPPAYLSRMIPPTQWWQGIPPGDPQLNLWALNWQWNHLTTSPGNILDGNAFFPDSKTLTGSDHLFSIALTTWPFYILFKNIFLTYHFSIWLSLTIGAAGMLLLALHLTRCMPAAILAATYFTIAFPRTMHAATHIQILSFHWAPWSIFYLLKYKGSAKLKHLLPFILFVTLQMLTSWYLAIFELLLLLPVIPFVLTGNNTFKKWIGMIVSGAMIAVLVWPFAQFYTGRSSQSEVPVEAFCSQWYDYWIPPYGTPVSILINDGSMLSERCTFLGYTISVLILTLLLNRTPRVTESQITLIAMRILGVLSIIASLWPFWKYLQASGVLTQLDALHLSFVRMIRAPARFSLVTVFCVAVMGADALSRLLAKTKTKKTQSLLVVSILMLTAIEHYPVFTLGAARVDLPAVYRWISNQSDINIIAEIPEFYGTDLWGFSSEYMLYSCFHGKSIVNGYSRFAPEGYGSRVELLNNLPSEESVQQLKDLGVDLVILHPQKYFHSHLRKLFAKATQTSDIPSAFREINRLASMNYQELSSPAGEEIESTFRNSKNLILEGQFERDLVFRLR